MRETEVEKKLIQEVEKRGGICEKWVSGTVGWPDRIVILPGGKIAFVETKRPGEKARAIQLYRHRQLRKLGMVVYVIDAPWQVGDVLNEIQSV